MSEEIGALVRDGFRCPICDFDAYCRIIVRRPNHSRYVTDFYRCGSCSVMFYNPATFSADARTGSPRSRSRPHTVRPTAPS